MLQSTLISEKHRTAGRGVGTRIALFVVFAPCWLWGVLALYYGSWPQGVCVVLALLYGVTHLACLMLAPLRHMVWRCAALFLLPLVAFHLMRPSNHRVWQPDVAQQPYAEIKGDQVTVQNVRNCAYLSETNFTVRYETRHYNLSQLCSADIFLVDWGLHKIAHTMLSFGFSDGQFLCFSIETRKEVGESYSAFKGLFRQYELIFIAGDERDLVRLRTNFRTGETARLYRLVKAPPEAIRGVFDDYMNQINALTVKPEWYNVMTENCMVGFFQIARKHAAAGRTRWHWSVLLNGYADRHAYEEGALDSSLPFDELRERSIINAAAVAAGDSPEFSALIRAGIPGIALKPQTKGSSVQ